MACFGHYERGKMNSCCTLAAFENTIAKEKRREEKRREEKRREEKSREVEITRKTVADSVLLRPQLGRITELRYN